MTLSLEQFGDELFRTGDLDPIYIMLERAVLPRPLLERWLLSYWCLYHAGLSSWVAEQEDFWAAMTEAAAATDRGTERRHFRGATARNAVATMAAQYSSVPDLFRMITAPDGRSVLAAEVVMQRVQTLPQFGPWIAFKVVDMLERVYRTPIHIPNNVVYLYDAPRAGLDAFTEHNLGRSDVRISNKNDALHYLLEYFSRHRAPPRYDRAANIAECETILCKHHAYLHGHYPIGKDCREIRHHLDKYADRSPLARVLVSCVPVA